MRVNAIFSGVLVVMICGSSISAGGLRTGLGEVVVENLQIGQAYNLAELANLSLRVTNTGEHPVNLRMEVLKPEEGELKLDAAALPDESWVTLTRDSFVVDAGQEAVSDIVISIPDEDQYLGKRFQFMIWSHTVPGSEGGMFLATGLKSRIIFTTDTVRAEPEDAVGTRSGNAAFSVEPSEIHLKAIPPGVRYDLEKAEGTVLRIRNSSKEELTLQLVSRTVSASMASLEPGWEDAPDAGFLTFEENQVTVAAQSERSVRLYLDIPDGAEFRGKHLMFMIHVFHEAPMITTSVYARVFAPIANE